MKSLFRDRRRLLEIAAIIAVTATIIGISRLEARLYGLSEALARDHALLASIFYYGIINLNVFLAILLSLLVIRNMAKLVVDRRRGVFGSRLRSKLVGVLMVFSLVPTVLVFYVSTRFITKSFDEWFGGRVKVTTQQTRDAGAQIYLQDQRRLENIAKLAALKIEVRASPAGGTAISVAGLAGFESEYSLQSLNVWDASGSSLLDGGNDKTTDTTAIRSLASRFIAEPQMTSASTVAVENGKDIIRAAVPVRGDSSRLLAIVVVEEKFDVPVLANIQTIMDGLSTLKPGAQLVRVSYLILITVMTLLIVFGAVWFGFYVARAITGPLQLLAEATKEVALGNYAIKLNSQSDDEAGQLTQAFNLMTRDLSAQKREVEEARARLEASNMELDRRRGYMETVFANIASGVIAVDANGVITAFNDSAIAMLAIKLRDPQGRKARDILSPELYERLFGATMDEAGAGVGSAARELDLRDFGVDATIFVSATRVVHQNGDFQGVVLVLDDATDRIRMQRATAWREVARRIAHEIKNPITPIKLSAERMLRRFAKRFEGDDRVVFESCVESILVQVDALRNLVNEFSKFSRMPVSELTSQSLNPVLAGAVEFYKHGYGQIKFVESYGAIPDISMDAEQINRMALNLISNAVDAIVEAGVAGIIEIRTRFDASIDAVVLEISDNGTGVLEPMRDRIFEPYFSTKDTGTGLGLAVVNQIVSDHGGYIRMIPGEVRGTIIRIEIPVRSQGKK
jgi:two-component system nitrogen regulation sensor histidine kinase NtrY